MECPESSAFQAERGGGHDEGFSIPAQREANKKKALSMGAIVGKEFVDRGASAKSADRPRLQAMLEYVKENADRVDYVIVHKVDRLARNRDDDSDIMRVLRECGVQLVSASESIDDTPSGMLLHGIMSSIAEFYSQNLATEVKKGMGEKVKGGGTIGRAPIGYQNVRYNDEKGREVRTVTLDPERSPLVKMAFEEYATGKWTLVSMTEYLGAIGLTTRPTPKLPSKPLGQTTVESMLKNPYYTGVVKYGGVEYPGSHEPLISRELFETVQAILSTRINGERVREHPHFLKGLLYCRKCKSRMLVTYAKSHTGVVYPYYICAGRHSRKKGSPDCNMRAILIDDVERQVESHLDQYKFDPDDRMLVEAYLDEAINKEQEKYKKELDLLTRKKIKLERNQEKLLESYYNDAIPLTLMKSEQKKITKELAIINSDIHAHNATFEEIRANLSLVLDMLEDCGKTYRMANDGIKRMLLIAMVDRIWIEEDGRIEPEMNNLCKEILRTNNEIKKSAPASADADSIRELFKSGSKFFGQGLNNLFLVELTETHSNYKIIIDYVKNYKPSPDENQIDPEMTDLSYNPDSVIKTITQKQKTLSDTETRTIITKYQQGKSTYELAREFGCHRATISRALKDNGIEVTNQCAKKKVLAEMIMQMYSEWYKPQEIGKALGVSADTVRRILHENNVYIRKSWEYPKK